MSATVTVICACGDERSHYCPLVWPKAAPVEERVARYMAAEDWLTDPADDAWWESRSQKFRDDYLASARRVIAIVQGAPAPAEERP